MTFDVDIAEDVTQESFLCLLEHSSRFSPERGSLRTFLLSVARNQCRIRRREEAFENGLGDDQIQDPDPGPMDLVVSGETREAVNRAVESLPPLQREALYLFEYDELSLQEAASIAGVDVGTFQARLYRARQRLKREFTSLMKRGTPHGTRP